MQLSINTVQNTNMKGNERTKDAVIRQSAGLKKLDQPTMTYYLMNQNLTPKGEGQPGPSETLGKRTNVPRRRN